MPQHLDRADVLQSWVLQTAIICAFALSTFGVAYTLRRPAMRALSEIWALYVATAIAGTIGSAMTAAASPSPLVSFFMTLSPALVVASLPANLAVVASIAERPRPLAKFPLASLWLGLAAFIVIFGGEVALVPRLNTAFWPRLFTTSIYAVSCAYAWRELGRATAHAGALRLLAAGFGLMGARVFINILVSFDFMRSSSETVNTSIVTMVQVFSIVIFGAFALLAVLDQERTAILAQASLVRDAEAGVATSRRFASLGRLSAGIAHDFNNILSTIVASAGLARLAARDAKPVDVELRIIEDAVGHATELTRQLQLFARNEESAPVVFDMNLRLANVATMLERIIGRNVRLDVATAAGAVDTKMDPSRFEQIVLNLVVNARDAMPKGGTIRIETAADALRTPRTPRMLGDVALAPGRYVRLSVADTGQGIPADVLPHIFEPFFTTKAAGGGSGIGLATCQSIAVEAGGAIEVQSIVGSGARFDVYLPAAPLRSTPGR
ncbi:MAG: sensor histidine kinase [Gemmatimonadales bacterium]